MTVANRESLVITVSATGYWPKKFEIKEPFDSLNLTLRQVSLYDPSNFIITSKPTDTIYFENGKIRRIEYQGHNVEDFYINGQIRYKCANSSTRSWYDNGQLKSQSLLKNPHLRIDTEWYSNGQKKSEGSTFFRYNEKRNEGEWINNDDWKYWTKKGKERKRKSKH